MRIFSELLEAIFPRYCMLCGKRLSAKEETICTLCYTELPFTYLCGVKGNYVERLFWDLPVLRASSFLEYKAGGRVAKILHELKYHDRPQVGRFFGRIMAAELIETDFFGEVDFILPVPLAPRRLRKRGYNQSLFLAKGISDITKIPIDSMASVRIVDNPTQTSLNRDERQQNVKDIFRVANVDALRNKYVLIVDDVLTTGATLRELIETLAQVEGFKASVLTLAYAGGRLGVLNSRES
ncbi:MAG: ComF family protein [Bacteroidaceae bacterium]|nr:ComF family protein [Bacteroidaceae bacterium]